VDNINFVNLLICAKHLLDSFLLRVDLMSQLTRYEVMGQFLIQTPLENTRVKPPAPWVTGIRIVCMYIP
jgi:hypothetical protein